MTTAPRQAPSVQEIVKALASGEASAVLQRHAAFVIPHLWRRRLPPGVSLNSRGRPWSNWYLDKRFYCLVEDRGGWPEEELTRDLSTGRADSYLQKLAAKRIVQAIDIHRLYEAKAKPKKLKESSWGISASVIMMAAEYELMGSSSPILDAMTEFAALDGLTMDQIKRIFRDGFKDNIRNIAPFVAEVDAAFASGEDPDQALVRAGQRRFDSWTVSELKMLYRHKKKGKIK
ncbi:hypothetical protein [Methylocystis sp. SB2]|uniref:hypothetical protein n=1 Tax=Methylocystis sp. (strain SB2) TaxID=743836 RepID=UPI0012EE3D39|nr:hypothetical protein [Methylocystis sp. SB2]ULO22972.1 hypothetical protein LNB28_12475 [Methylocystis sp. SB2]